MRSERTNSKIEPTITPHWAVPVPPPAMQHVPSGFLRQGSPEGEGEGEGSGVRDVRGG